jgi:hypothetical protein
MVDSVPMKFAFDARMHAASTVAIVVSLVAGAVGFAGCRLDADPPGDSKRADPPGRTSAAPGDAAPTVRPWVPKPIVARPGRRPVTPSEANGPVRVATGGPDSAAGNRPVVGSVSRKKRHYELTPADSARWPVPGPAPLPGSLLPDHRIVAYYGNPKSTRMGILGQIPPAEMLPRLERTATEWAEADTTRPVMPALHLIATVAQEKPGPGGKYRLRHSDQLIEQVLGWAEERGWIVFLDVQIGHSSVADELAHLVKYLERPYVHLALDPEFAMKRGGIPGRRIGTLDAADVNYASRLLADIVDRKKLPPKVLVIHRFTQRMLTNHDRIKLDPRVQIVVNMDGFGAPWHKEDAYRFFIVPEPVQYPGLKLFYKNDKPMMTPGEVLRLWPEPLYIQYQ